MLKQKLMMTMVKDRYVSRFSYYVAIAYISDISAIIFLHNFTGGWLYTARICHIVV